MTITATRIGPWLVVFALMLTAAALPAQAGEPPAARVLVITGGHDFDQAAFRSIFEKSDTLKPTFATDKDEPHPFANIEDWPYDAIVLYNFHQTLTEQQRQNFMRLLDRGTGLVVLHHAISAYEDWPEYAELVGGDFVRESPYRGESRKTSTFDHDQDITISVAESDHRVTEGLPSRFTIHDETYEHLWLAEDMHVLLTTNHPLSDEPLAWTRTPGNKRLVYIQPGQGPDVFKRDEYRRLVANAVHWSSRADEKKKR
jgi:type 1 glutamine amidotransferase